MKLIRKQIYLDAETDARLKREARILGVSQAAIIRRLLHAGSGAVEEPRAAALLNDTRAAYAALTPGPSSSTWRDHMIVEETIALLAETSRRAATGKGNGWKFNREELYEDRVDRQYPR